MTCTKRSMTWYLSASTCRLDILWGKDSFSCRWTKRPYESSRGGFTCLVWSS